MTTARSYLQPLVRESWLDLVREDVIDPSLPIIDAHHHLWNDRVLRGRNWAQYLERELSVDVSSGHNIVATIFMQCGWQHRTEGPEELRPVGETQSVAAFASRFETGKTRACKGIIGFADLRGPHLDDVLLAHREAGGGRFRGIRHSAAWDDAIEPQTSVIPPPDLLHDPQFQKGVRRLGESGFVYDGWQYHTQLKDLAKVASQAPETRIVVDHTGGPLGFGPYRGRRDEVAREWTAGMKELASHPNVFVKLGGLGMSVNGFDYHNDALPPHSDQLATDWKPWIVSSIEMFDADRCMFESNFPYDKGMYSYVSVWNAFKKIVADASRSEKALLFHDTAKKCYSLR